MILAGLWCSRDKPTMNMFLKPLVDSANNLYHTGSYMYANFKNVALIAGLI